MIFSYHPFSKVLTTHTWHSVDRCFVDRANEQIQFVHEMSWNESFEKTPEE